MVFIRADDLDGTTANVKPVAFNLDGIDYEIDLSPEHAAALRNTLSRYAKRAREVDQPPVPISPTRIIRDWANVHGYNVSDRGKIPVMVVEAFKLAHSG